MNENPLCPSDIYPKGHTSPKYDNVKFVRGFKLLIVGFGESMLKIGSTLQYFFNAFKYGLPELGILSLFFHAGAIILRDRQAHSTVLRHDLIWTLSKRSTQKGMSRVKKAVSGAKARHFSDFAIKV